jgi:hypothetical protein
MAVVPTPRLLSKKTPHPTGERGAGQRTDLDFPDAPERREGRWCLTPESTGAFGAKSFLSTKFTQNG